MSQPDSKPTEDKPTQTTEKGLKIPVPTREEFVRNLEKVAPKPVETDPEPPSGDPLT